jgi:heat shock protein HtpX
VPAVVLAVVLGATVGPVAGVVALVVVAVTGALYVRRRCVARALAILGAAPCHPDRHPRLYNVTEGLCATFGLRMPELWVVDDPAINACALGRAGGEATLVFTTGVLTRLDLDQLEGLVAHELAHVKRHDAVVGAAAIVVLWPLSRLTRRDGYLHAMVGQGREYLADQLAAATIRYPSGLRDALVAMTGGPPPAPSSVLEPPRLATTRWIWADPDPGAGPATRADMGGSLDTLAVRAAALAEW